MGPASTTTQDYKRRRGFGAPRIRRLAIGLGLVAALTLSLGVGGAAAHEKLFSPRVDITTLGALSVAQAAGPMGTALVVEGKVKSRKGKCKNRRRVEL